MLELLAESRASSLEELLFLGLGQYFELAVEIPIPQHLLKEEANGRSLRIARYEVRIGRDRESATGEPPHILAETLWLTSGSGPENRRPVVQVLVATHSPFLIGLIEPAQLLCFSTTAEGETDVVTGDQHPRLKDWRSGVPLSRLYAAGILS